MMENKNYAEQLREIYNFLTPENWTKQNFISLVKINSLCFCIHGAAENICNPKVKNAQGIMSKRSFMIFNFGIEGYSSFLNWKNYFEAWRSRKRYEPNSNLFEIHFLLGMFGLTTSFNDNPGTTLADIKSKLMETIIWCENNAEFLANN